MTPAQRLSVLTTLLVACNSTTEPSGHPVQLGEEQVCESPTEGLDRFVEAAEAHGLTRRVGAETNGDSSIPLAVGIAAADADSDGDIDLFLSVESAFPQVLENDGSGHFTEVPQNVALDAVQAIALLGFAVVDFDGDGLRDVLLFGPRSVELSRNLGGLEFAPLRTVYSESANEVGVSISASFGDVDLDGDLDLFLPGLDPVASQAPTEFGQSPSVDRLLLREKAQFVLGTTMEAAVGPGISMVGLFTDRDSDGDQDLLVPTLRGAFGMAPTAFYRNTGDDETSELFHEDASQIHADLAMSGMGVDSADLNRDEDLDYCISDLNRIQCLLSDGDGAFYEGAQALGLMLPDAPPGNGWSGWSIDLVDLDNDGHLDAVVAGGAPLNEVGDGLDYSHSPNQIWQGGEEGFTRHSSALLAGETDHYGLLSADLNGDGAQDLLFSGRDGELQAYYSQCTSGSWVDVQLAGPPGNEQGFGARIFLRADKRRRVRQIQNLRGFSQGPARAHFGLGDAKSVEKLTVLWPDGTITISRDLPVNRSLRVPHPIRFIGEGETGGPETGLDSGLVGATASLSGTVTRSAGLIHDGVGELFVLLFKLNPIENPGESPVAWASFEADFSAEEAAIEFHMDGIPLGANAYHVAGFLDDNGSGLSTGPDSGDLIATTGPMSFPLVHFEEAIEYELDLDLNFGLP